MAGRGQNASTAVMARRAEPSDSLDFFPTPPWATRALCEHLNRWGDTSAATVWEPACGNGHMAAPLMEYFHRVWASDVFAYPFVAECGVTHDFLFPAPPNFPDAQPHFIITNPPFRLAEQFALKAIAEAQTGVALLVRTAFLEGVGRLERLFRPHPPQWVLQFSERVPMIKGRWDPKAASATAYCWVVWTAQTDPAHCPVFVWLDPCRRRLSKPNDIERFGS